MSGLITYLIIKRINKNIKVFKSGAEVKKECSYLIYNCRLITLHNIYILKVN